MIVARLQGGLGNQMFQYSAGVALADKYSCELKVDLTLFSSNQKSTGFTPREFELDVFDIDIKLATEDEIGKFKDPSMGARMARKLGLNYPKRYSEKKNESWDDFLKTSPPVMIEGYFQNWRIPNSIKPVFKFKEQLIDDRNSGLFNDLRKNPSVAIHIRRGDYVTDPVTNSYHGTCSPAYYQQAIEKVKSFHRDPYLVFFSDDIDFVRNEFGSVGGRKMFVDFNNGKSSWKDMYLMSGCKYHIIANSSFSWWGAWLANTPPNSVIAPSRWFAAAKDAPRIDSIIPGSWMKI